ncbi:MAG: hypothetical protein AAF657_13040, partial [Acidobacteriota bacterium]
MWMDHVGNFENAARSKFSFLTGEKGFEEPTASLFRDLSVDFNHPEKGWRVSICWERSWLLPLVSLDATESEEASTHQLTYLLRLMKISVDSKAFPLCEKLSRKIVPGIGEMWTHFRRKKELLLEYPRFLDAHAEALRREYDALWTLACDPATPQWVL